MNKFGSEVHDKYFMKNLRKNKQLTGGFKGSRIMGGIEGGINGEEPIVVRAYMKPIPTLKPLVCRFPDERIDYGYI